MAGLPPLRAKVASRKIGAGPECKACKSRNTRVRFTKGPTRYPSFVDQRKRYLACADCGEEWSVVS